MHNFTALPGPRSAAFSAFVTGALLSIVFSPSPRSFSGLVLTCAFADPARANRFARRWAVRLHVAVPVRRLGARHYEVSVPVHWPSSRLPSSAGYRLSWSGGLRGFIRQLSSSGLIS